MVYIVGGHLGDELHGEALPLLGALVTGRDLAEGAWLGFGFGFGFGLGFGFGFGFGVRG